ncbi:MAG: TonB family protein, partial [Deltaproteobacteria bacterium]|nr:TonB family protein [Deltaproteobacteria bacterium]
MTTHEERKIFQVEKVEVTLPKKEQEPVTTPPVQSEVRIVSVSEPKPSPSNNEKIEMGSKKEERIVLASLGNPVSSVNPSEKPRVAMKSPSLSESEIVFAQPRYSENPKPLYPQEARKKGYEGEILLRVEVLSNGRVGEIEVRRSSGHEVLDRSAVAAVKQWKFVPAKKGETQVPLWVNIPVTFQLR